MSVIETKVERLLGLLKEASPQLASQCEVEVREDGSRMIYGPFPSFLILVEEIGESRALIHVNADAPNLVYIFKNLTEVAFDGPFAVDGATGGLIVGPSAYAKKEENILMFAKDILARRQEAKQEGILVPEKKIILAS